MELENINKLFGMNYEVSHCTRSCVGGGIIYFASPKPDFIVRGDILRGEGNDLISSLQDLDRQLKIWSEF